MVISLFLNYNICNLIKIYTIRLNNYLGWAGTVHGLGGFSSGLSWAGLKRSGPRSTHQFHGSSWAGLFVGSTPVQPTRPKRLDWPALLVISTTNLFRSYLTSSFSEMFLTIEKFS